MSDPVAIGRCRWGHDAASAEMAVGAHRATVGFWNVAPDRNAPDAFATAARILAQDGGRRIRSRSGVTATARRRSEAFGRLHRFLHTEQRHAPLLAPPARRSHPAAGRRVAAFFSGGVDSLHLLLEHDDVDDLLFVRGFDVAHDDEVRAEEVLAPVRAAAADVGKPLLVVDTDIRRFTDPLVDWAWFSYGAMLAVSILLARTHRRVLMAASVADRHLPPEVPAARRAPFGNDAVRVELVGIATTRVDKVLAVADSGIGTSTLRVCWQNVPGTLNCGRCDKCLRTMTAFAAAGRRWDEAVFPGTLDLDDVAAFRTATRSDRAFVTESLEAARENGEHGLAEALQTALADGGASVG